MKKIIIYSLCMTLALLWTIESYSQSYSLMNKKPSRRIRAMTVTLPVSVGSIPQTFDIEQYSEAIAASLPEDLWNLSYFELDKERSENAEALSDLNMQQLVLIEEADENKAGVIHHHVCLSDGNGNILEYLGEIKSSPIIENGLITNIAFEPFSYVTKFEEADILREKVTIRSRGDGSISIVLRYQNRKKDPSTGKRNYEVGAKLFYNPLSDDATGLTGEDLNFDTDFHAKPLIEPGIVEGDPFHAVSLQGQRPTQNRPGRIRVSPVVIQVVTGGSVVVPVENVVLGNN